jgi:hypothetical protein
MRELNKILVALALVFGCLGCRSQQLAHDQDHIREAVMDLQTNQIMDNLIRARKGLPILQLDYLHMTGTVTDTGSATAGDSYTSVRATAAKTLTNVFSFNATGSQVNQLTITAEPVTTAPEVYNAYLEFLKDPNHLVETRCPPPPNAAVIVRCCAADCCGVCPPKRNQPRVYYSVPRIYKDDFFKLALYTVALRGQPVAVSPDFDVTITGFDPRDMHPDKAGTYYVGFTIDKKIPNDDGYLIATINGMRFENNNGLKVLYTGSDHAISGKPLTKDQQSTGFVLVFNAKQLGLPAEVKLDITDVVDSLTDQKVGIRLKTFLPGGSQTDRLLEDVRSQLELSRLNQLQLFPAPSR